MVVRDKRRVDPETGEVRPVPDSASASGPSGPVSGPAGPAVEADLVEQLAERTGDLQRLKAEYDNYRRRVDRDRAVAGEMATARTVAALLPTLDDIGRAKAHGELEGGFRSVAEGLEKALVALGLESFGQAGDPFDPTLHEAVLHSYSPDVLEPTCVEVFSLGWKYADRVLRPAQVAVAEPVESPGGVEDSDGAAHDPAQ